MFDPITYMKCIHWELKITREKYTFATVSGVNELEEVLENSKRNDNFFAVDDSQDGFTYRLGGGYFERRPYTVFILGKATYGNMEERGDVLAEAKSIFRSILSRLIIDKKSIPVLDMERIQFYEVPPAFATGCSGLYFIFNVDVPVNLTYDAAEWGD